MTEQAHGTEAPSTPVFDEIRARRLVVVGEDGSELATLQVRHGVIELRLGEGTSGIPCSAVMHAGQPQPGMYAAGLELWAHGNSIGGWAVSLLGDHIETHHFTRPD